MLTTPMEQAAAQRQVRGRRRREPLAARAAIRLHLHALHVWLHPRLAQARREHLQVRPLAVRCALVAGWRKVTEERDADTRAAP